MKITILAKAALTVAVVVTVGGGLAAYLVYNSSSSALKNSISSNLSNDTKQTLDKIDRFLYERQLDTEQFVQRPQFQEYLAQHNGPLSVSVSYLNKLLNDYKVVSGVWSDVTLVDKKGKVSLTTDIPSSSNALAHQTEFKELFSKAIQGQNTYSDVILESATLDPIMLFMSPFRNTLVASHPIVGVFVGQLEWAAALEILQDQPGVLGTILNSQGKFLGDSTHSINKGILSKDFSKTKVFGIAKSKPTGNSIGSGLSDPKDSYLTAYTHEAGYLDYKGNDWIVIYQSLEQTAFIDARQLALKLVETSVVILSISILGTIFILNRQIVRPITKLKDASLQLAQGNFTSPLIIKSRDEIGELGRSFNEMAQKLQGAYHNLKLSTQVAQNERNTVETLINNLPVGVFVAKAPGGEPLMVNHAGLKLLGRGVDPRINAQTYAEVYQTVKEDGKPYPNADLPLTIALREGKISQKDDLIIKRPNGELVALRVMAAPIKNVDGSFNTAVAVFEDISKERELERSREEFFSIASHELRTPLTAIRGNSDLIQQYYGDKIEDPNLKEMVLDIHESAIRLIDIVNDFLDTSRLEQKRMKFELQPVDLISLAEATIKEYQVTGSRQKIHLEIKPPSTDLPKAYADSNRVKQVLINLVGNGLKFTDSGSITISFSTDKNTIKTLVTDTGHGMTPEAQKLLFHKFEQTGSTVLTRDSVRGTGLGLYISKMIVEQMGGHIQLESSKVGVGTTFSFTLPIKPPSN